MGLDDDHRIEISSLVLVYTKFFITTPNIFYYESRVISWITS